MTINQFHSGTAVGDAITNQMFLIQKIVRDRGIKSEIYAEHIPMELKNKVVPVSKIESNEDNVLIIHHSMGMNCFNKIVDLKDKKILIYHNITPERFFDDEITKKFIRLGLKQVKDYKNYIDYCIADSNYNRQELIHMGYNSNIDVMPVQISLDRFDNIQANTQLIQNLSKTTNILFVGRVVWNKCQTDLVKAFAVYHNYYNRNSQLIIVGDNSLQGYIEEIRSLASKFGVLDKVRITGKVSEEDLKAYYEGANVFLCMSEHEGFGVPLLEAMKMGVPVIAYGSSAIPETMGGTGIVFSDKNYAYIGTLINEVIEDKNLYNAIVKHQYTRLKKLEDTDTEKIIFNAIENMYNGQRKKTIQMQGPFETSYSLAIVNRKLIEAMDEDGRADVSIHCTEGPGDYQPRKEDLIDKPLAKKLWEKSKDVIYPDITIRNMYPPRANDVNGGLNFYSFGWEESVIPQEYIENFNRYLDGIGTTSQYVTDKLIECGLTIPVKTMGNGVDLCDGFDELKEYPLRSKKKIKFLHISSAFPRKGVDILLKAYYMAFNGDDDVCLILKTFPNPHNNVEQLMKELNSQYLNPPEIEWINCDLSNKKLYSLYKVADCYVHVARGEGFGLPVAEAMLAKVPVIVSPNSGMADFCNASTALLVDYDLEPAHTHLTTASDGNISMWAEPQVDSLITQMKRFIEESKCDYIKTMVENAYQLIKQEFSWKKVSSRWFEFIHEVEKKQYRPKVAMVTTWNSKCGIAEYTKMQVNASNSLIDYEIYPNYGVELICKDESYVKTRLWDSAFSGNMDALVETLEKSSSKIVHFQFNFGFYSLENLGKAIRILSQDKKVMVSFHKTEDSDIGGKRVSLRSIVNELNMCDALVVHQEKDITVLKEFGVKEEKIWLIPLGQIVYPEITSLIRKEENRINESLVIGSYGFLLPHKGIKEVIQALPILKHKWSDILYMPVCALHESIESKEYFQECINEAERLNVRENVRFVTEFLPNNESMKLLQACDVLVMAYKPSKESASGAIRFCLAAYRPTITTKQSIFDEVKECTYQIDESSPNNISEAITKVMDQAINSRLVERQKEYIRDNSWCENANKFYSLYCSLSEN